MDCGREVLEQGGAENLLLGCYYGVLEKSVPQDKAQCEPPQLRHPFHDLAPATHNRLHLLTLPTDPQQMAAKVPKLNLPQTALRVHLLRSISNLRRGKVIIGYLIDPKPFLDEESVQSREL